MKVIYLTMFCLVSVSAITYNKTEEGYSAGYMSNCRGIFKPAYIKPKSLERLFISVLGPGNVMTAKWTPYNYYHIGDLAKHPDIDFKRKKTFMYVDGWIQSTSWPFGRTLGRIYRDLGYNVLMLDMLEFTANYFPVAARLVRPVGRHVAEMLMNLTAQGLDPKKLELVGISIGAHTMGFIAKSYQQIIGKNISSLTAIDPAGPCFRNLGPDQRLDASDADFVLHVVTNADGFGMGRPLGHVTFYVNGGEFQPFDLWLLPCTVICSHIKAFLYYVSALLNPHTFIGIQCDSVQQAKNSDCYDRKPRVTNTLDLFTDRNKPGIYYLATYHRYPYALGKRGLKRKHDPLPNYMYNVNEPDAITAR